MTSTLPHTYAQDGHKYGLNGWWTVYRDEKPIYHYYGRGNAVRLAHYLNNGLTMEDAIAKVQGS